MTARSALQDNIHLLGDILGETIRAQESAALLDKIEQLRALAKKSRAGGKSQPSAQDMIAKILARLPADDQYKIAKAFTLFMQLVNVAEQTHRIRRRRQYRAHENAPQKSSPDDVFTRLLKSGVAPGRIKQALADMNIELVITAHPTEVMLPDTIRAWRDLSANLLSFDNPALAAEEREQVTDDIRAIVLRQWDSHPIRDERPSPEDEARYGIELTEKILWDAVPMFFRQLRAAYRRRIGSMADLYPCPVRFGSWMGGDRDGHPGVTAEVTRNVLEMSLAAARRLYGRELAILRAKLLFDTESPVLAALQPRIRRYLKDLISMIDARRPQADVMRKLEALKMLLQQHDLLMLAEKELQNLIWRLRVFGLSLLKLDIRQASNVHAAAVGDFISGYESLSENDKIKKLTQKLSGKKIAPPKSLGRQTREVLATMALLQEYPAELFGCYIISMAGSASDILAVQFLLRAAGVTRKVPISPLFETPDTLAAAPGVMAALYKIPAYRRYAGKHQDIMVGYSDSGKRGGYIRSLWDIYLLQEKLARAGVQNGIETVFFHGRGGALARGGGPIESTLDMMPHPQMSRRIRITEQGEIINAKFGMPGIAGRTLERYLSGMMDAFFAKQKTLPPAWRQMMERLASASAAAFRAKVYDDPSFMPHFEALTPARELKLLKIGSRPGSRKKGGGLESMRAIPWIISWTQPRVMMPAWEGVAAAIGAEIKNGQLKKIQDMYRHWPFFKAIIDMIEMSVSLADEEVAHYYSKLLVPAGLQKNTHAYLQELSATRRLIRKVKQENILLAGNTVLQHAIDVRTPYVDVLNILQAQLLKKYRTKGHKTPAIKKTLALTFSGISAGMHNTG